MVSDPTVEAFVGGGCTVFVVVALLGAPGAGILCLRACCGPVCELEAFVALNGFDMEDIRT